MPETPHAALPIIAMTAGDERGVPRGMNGIITRPIDVTLLYETLADIVGRHTGEPA